MGFHGDPPPTWFKFELKEYANFVTGASSKIGKALDDFTLELRAWQDSIKFEDRKHHIEYRAKIALEYEMRLVNGEWSADIVNKSPQRLVTRTLMVVAMTDTAAVEFKLLYNDFIQDCTLVQP
jgi:hypothetical protein